MTENDIIKGCLKNNRESQKALYDMFYTKMLGICQRYAKDNTEAKEILQEGFYKVFGDLKNFKVTGSFEEWLRKIIVNSCIEHLRRNKQNLIVSTVYATKAPVKAEEAMSDEELVLQIGSSEIIKAVQQLTPAYRMVFNLFSIEKYSHKEIAGMLDISEDTSESNLSKAKFNLRKNLRQLIKNSDGR